MLERFRRSTDGEAHREERGGVATAERPRGRRFEREGDGAPVAREARSRQRGEFGGVNWGSAFFGWLVSLGMAAILVGILSAAGAALGYTDDAEFGEAVSIVGGALLVVFLCLAYFCGGYVSGRMSRFDGGRQGLGTWAIGLLATILLGIVGLVAGTQYNVFADLELPRVPVDEGDLTSGGIAVLLGVLLVTLLAAAAGGKTGERYHRKVDRFGYGP